MTCARLINYLTRQRSQAFFNLAVVFFFQVNCYAIPVRLCVKDDVSLSSKQSETAKQHNSQRDLEVLRILMIDKSRMLHHSVMDYLRPEVVKLSCPPSIHSQINRSAASITSSFP